MNSAVAALIGLVLAIVLIIKKLQPVYSLMIGALAGGLLAGWGLDTTVNTMIGGVNEITPAILRILAAGVLSGVLIKTGAAASISHSIVKTLGRRHVYLAVAFSTMLLTGVGVFIDVAVITVAPIALLLASRLSLSRASLLLAMIGGGKCGNIMSPNPNTIIAAENYDAPLSSVMGAGVVPALIGLVVTVYLIVPMMSRKKDESLYFEEIKDESLPSFFASISGPLVAVILLSLRPICDIKIDPVVALPAGGIVGLLMTRSWRKSSECLSYGLEKMSTVAILLVGTGTIAGIIKASEIKDVLIAMLSGWDAGGVVMAPLSGSFMSAATASTTAGATIASASFAQTVLAAGVASVWGASMTNAGATMLDHLPHGSFFHATGGSVGMQIKERMRLIPYETLIGLVLTLLSLGMYYVTTLF
ncbi:MAG: GntP family permease [Bacteroidales bacterium]|nr:GntP family permease [Bacteroidales bacterium]